jgi:Cu(I)/Ag(I) efflux system protein CusF
MERKMKALYSTMLALALALPFASHANTEAATAAVEAPAGETAQTSMTEGEIKRINKETGKLTIKHGPIVNLNMPAMTMVFRAADAAMLDQVKVGDQVRFVVEKIEGKYTVTQLQPAQ